MTIKPGQGPGTGTAGAPERRLWDELAAQGRVRGPYVCVTPVPWPVRMLMGAAGWGAALCLQLFVMTTLFVAADENAAVLAASGLAMVAVAAGLYRRKAGSMAFEQFALALSLTGQGLAIYGATAALESGRVLERPVFWAGVAIFGMLVYIVIQNPLHRLLAACMVLAAATIALMTGAAHTVAGMLAALPWVLTGVAIGAALLLGAYTHWEAALAAAGRQPWIAPFADALFATLLASALLVTGMSHPLSMLGDPAYATQGSAHWLAGAAIGGVATAFAWVESARLGLNGAARLGVLAATAVFAALLSGAPAVVAGAFGLALALRRGAPVWLGLAVVAIGAGFAWYYGALHWTLLIKSATLVAAGIAVLASRAWLARRGTDARRGETAA